MKGVNSFVSVGTVDVIYENEDFLFCHSTTVQWPISIGGTLLGRRWGGFSHVAGTKRSDQLAGTFFASVAGTHRYRVGRGNAMVAGNLPRGRSLAEELPS